MQTLLIADDHQQIVSILTEYAKKEGFCVFSATNGREALELFGSVHPDILLLDVMMPEIDGFEVCRKIRMKSNIPVIMVTARGEDYDRIMGLDIGADDYIVKPFSPSEVMARIRAILRRIDYSSQSEQIFKFENLTINLEDFTVNIDNQPIPLTKKEIELLWTLASYKNKVFTRENLLDSIWGIDYCGDNRTVDSHIKRMRAKMDVIPHDKWEIKTIWGVGYKFEVNVCE